MSFFDKLKQGLNKTKTSFDEKINNVFSGFRKVDEELLEELEEALIMSDVGTRNNTKNCRRIKKKNKKRKYTRRTRSKESIKRSYSRNIN